MFYKGVIIIKKFGFLILTSSLLLALVGCSDNGSTDSGKDDKKSSNEIVLNIDDKNLSEKDILKGLYNYGGEDNLKNIVLIKYLKDKYPLSDKDKEEIEKYYYNEYELNEFSEAEQKELATIDFLYDKELSKYIDLSKESAEKYFKDNNYDKAIDYIAFEMGSEIDKKVNKNFLEILKKANTLEEIESVEKSLKEPSLFTYSGENENFFEFYLMHNDDIRKAKLNEPTKIVDGETVYYIKVLKETKLDFAEYYSEIKDIMLSELSNDLDKNEFLYNKLLENKEIEVLDEDFDFLNNKTKTYEEVDKELNDNINKYKEGESSNE